MILPPSPLAAVVLQGAGATSYWLLAGVALLLLVMLALGMAGLRRRGRPPADPEPPPASPPAPRSDEEDTQPLLSSSLAVAARPPETGPVPIRAAARTDPGMVREVNEDVTVSAGLEDATGEVRTGLYAVADGVGGYDQGEVASRTAIDAALATLEHEPLFTNGEHERSEPGDEAVLDVLRNAVVSANRAVYGKRVDQGSNMGTTLVLALVMRGRAYLANVGDSRAYLLRRGQVRQLTEDHSLVERMLASGQITEAEARRHPQRNLIFRSLGMTPDVDIDLFVERLQPGDRILLCSDGLSDLVPDEQLARIAGAERDLDRACRSLIDAANGAGGTDNISVVLAEVLPQNGEASRG